MCEPYYGERTRHGEVEYLIDPYINALYATPRIALVPLLILWLGLDTQMKIFVVFLGSFFPIEINTTRGVKHVSAHYVEVTRAYGATERQIFRQVILPSATPFIMAGFRLGVGRALVGMVVAELLGTLSGLGAMVDKYASEFDTEALFVPILYCVPQISARLFALILLTLRRSNRTVTSVGLY